MIHVEVNHRDLAYVQRQLHGLEDQAPKVLRSAVNETAVRARKLLVQHAKERYAVKNAGFNSRTKIRRATLANLTATIQVGGKTLTMSRFHTTHPAKPKKGRTGVKAEILAKAGLKEVAGSRKIKAFVAKVSSGSKATSQVLQRTGKSRYPLKVLRSVSVPKMIEKVYNGGGMTETGLKREIEQLYQESVRKQIEKAVGK